MEPEEPAEGSEGAVVPEPVEGAVSPVVPEGLESPVDGCEGAIGKLRGVEFELSELASVTEIVPKGAATLEFGL